VKRLLIAAALAGLLAAVPASAAAPGGRATAAAFRQATIDLHFTVKQQGPAIAEAIKRLDGDPACSQSLEHAPDAQVVELVFEYVLPGVLELEFDPLKRSFSAFSARLETIAVNDRTLRSGRAAWRELAASFARMPAPPADFCARLAAWRQAGYPAAQRPKIKDPIYEELLSEESRIGHNFAKVERAGPRLRELGVSKRVVGWWTFDTLLDDIEHDDLAAPGPVMIGAPWRSPTTSAPPARRWPAARDRCGSSPRRSSPTPARCRPGQSRRPTSSPARPTRRARRTACS
jgi:hypothetical protein